MHLTSVLRVAGAVLRVPSILLNLIGPDSLASSNQPTNQSQHYHLDLFLSSFSLLSSLKLKTRFLSAKHKHKPTVPSPLHWDACAQCVRRMYPSPLYTSSMHARRHLFSFFFFFASLYYLVYDRMTTHARM
jgi:hypothetical protein